MGLAAVNSGVHGEANTDRLKCWVEVLDTVLGWIWLMKQAEHPVDNL